MLDFFSRAVVGWATSSNNDTELALATLEDAIANRKPPPGIIHHSDRGSRCASARYRRHLDTCGMLASMSSAGIAGTKPLLRASLPPSRATSSSHNPIERVWRDMHAAVIRNHRCKTFIDLCQRVIECLNAYDGRQAFNPSLQPRLAQAA